MKLYLKLGLGVIIFLALIFVFSSYNFSTEQESLNDQVYVFPPFSEVYNTRPIKFNPENIDNSFEKYFFDKKLRKKLFNSANMMVEPDKNPEVRVIQEIDKGKYIEQKISLIINPSTIAYAYLLIPKNVSNPAPLILAMHPHGGFYEYGKDWVAGNKGTSDGFYGKELAERGYIVFAMDAPLFGDRTLGNLKNENSPETLENFGSQSLINLKHSLLGETLREDISVLNLIFSLETIDKENIGCIGYSFGGVRCMYLAALDERIKAVVLSNSVGNIRRDYSDGILQSWFTVLPGVAEYTEMSGIITLISPRPLMILSSDKDPIFPLNEAEEQVKIINLIYKRLGKENLFKFIIEKNEAHTFPKEYREEAYEFFDKFLKK